MSLQCSHRQGQHSCRTPLEERVDRLGRVTFGCPACKRREAGICQRCPRRVCGTVGQSLYCAECKRANRREVALAHWFRHHDVNKKKQRSRNRIRPSRAMTRQESGHLGGLIGGPMRAAMMTPAQRVDIARKAGRLGGKASQAARSAERKREIAALGNAKRWGGLPGTLLPCASSAIAS